MQEPPAAAPASLSWGPLSLSLILSLSHPKIHRAALAHRAIRLSCSFCGGRGPSPEALTARRHRCVRMRWRSVAAARRGEWAGRGTSRGRRRAGAGRACSSSSFALTNSTSAGSSSRSSSVRSSRSRSTKLGAWLAARRSSSSLRMNCLIAGPSHASRTPPVALGIYVYLKV